MKSKFEFSLQGKDWFLPFICFWVLYLVLYIPLMALSSKTSSVALAQNGAYWGLNLLLFVFMIFAYPIFIIVLLRIFAPKLAVDGKPFAFNGNMGKFLGMYVGGSLLSVITLGVYLPWFMRKIVAYLAGETSLDGKSFDFRGKGGKLFVYLLLSLWVPLIALIVIFTCVMVASGSASTLMQVLPIVILLFVVILMAPLIFLFTKWYANVGWDNLHITLTAKFWPATGYVLGQLLLSLITLFIYFPAAGLRIYRYFAANLAIEKDGRRVGGFNFQGGIGKGFGLVWGQCLLSIITLGIYIPWATAKIYRWFASETEVEITED
jgi:uncharacterized membrane protein YjgN (DUF898 family)